MINIHEYKLQMMINIHTVLKVVYTLYIVPTGLGALAGSLSIDIISLTGQSVNRQMKDAGIRFFL